MLFKELKIDEYILKALDELGYEQPTPIQEQSIPYLLEGRDMLGCAQTGTGKTAAFSIPVLQQIFCKKKIEKGPKVIRGLILAPTRELAIQIGESVTTYGKYIGVKNLVVYGGVSQKHQARSLKIGIDIIIATPGRLLDLVNQKLIDLSKVEHLVLDEADRMLEMGMIEDVKRIISKLPKDRQNMLFSATMPKEVKKIVDSILKNPVKVEVAPVSSTIDTIEQQIYFVAENNKKRLLLDLLKDETIKSVLVFSRTKHGANKITQNLEKAGIEAKAIHGDKSQNARQRALNTFKDGSTRVLVATDIAARGIDVDELSHVINYDLPEMPETYVHRIGRTGRAGRLGIAISFCSEREKNHFNSIEKLIGKRIPVVQDHPYRLSERTIDEEQQKSMRKPTSKKKTNNWRYNKKRR